MKKICAIALIVCLLAAAFALPAGAASEDYVTARTSIADASSEQIANIDRTIDALSEYVVAEDAVFSFNEIVGPRTKKRGFVSAVNGRGSKVVGGGVAQVATTMYLALMEMDGVIFGDLDTYGDRFTGGYVDDGDLAIVTEYDKHDFTFTNETGAPLLLELWMSQANLYCTVSMQKTGGMDFGSASDSWFVSAPDPENDGASRSITIASARIFCDDDDALRNNIRLAADSIYDTTLASGDEFSFNAIVGPREKRCGYQTAVNGRGADVVGGGVAQVASAVWLSVKDLDDVSIIEKNTYGKRYNQSYVSSSADAIVTDYNAGTDFAFRYDGEDSITIYTWLDGDTLCCDVCLNQ